MTGKDDEPMIARSREEIDRIDLQLLDLLNRRAACALEIGRIKKKINEPIYVPERERSVLAKLAEANRGPLSTEAVHGVFQAIFDQMKRIEETTS
ncbi:MAG: chorismate mutase [SAR324 cluster bacterium]|nr:chorismate mutase [SAR324 cluster bacterium]